MASFSKGDVVLVQSPFTDLSAVKVRPGVIVSVPHVSVDVFIAPLTSNTAKLLPGEFVLADWQSAGLNVPTPVKRGIFTINSKIVIKHLGTLAAQDGAQLEQSLRDWLGL